MKKNKKHLQSISIVSMFFIFLLVFINYTFSNLHNNKNLSSPELTINSFSAFSKTKGKVVAASCGFAVSGVRQDIADAGHDIADFSDCPITINCCYGGPVTGFGQSLCGGACGPVTMTAKGSISNLAGPTPNGYSTPICPNHPTMGQACTSSPNACGNTTTGIYNQCGSCNAAPPPVIPCTLTNVCGEIYNGYICGGVCNAGSGVENINNSCIRDFRTTTNTINPNGSVQFSWSVNNTTSRADCSFVDLTSPTPRPIPGLQNLSPVTDKVRITNIQASTRFCLICQFYSLVNGSLLGEAAKHQWIRVQRIGEN